MTQKDYIAFAEALKNMKPEMKGPMMAQWMADVLAIAKVLAEDNPRFDKNRFMVAAGY